MDVSTVKNKNKRRILNLFKFPVTSVVIEQGHRYHKSEEEKKR